MLVIGIDIGGTKIRAVLWNGKGVTREREVPTPKSKNGFQRRLVALASSLHRHRVDAIGIGAAGIIKDTTLLFSPNIPYIKNFDFRSVWPSLPVRVDNDARSFARAELVRGASRGAKRLFALTIGTGIGRAYGKKGKIIRLKRFEYPEQWEKRYQVIRNTRGNNELAEFLAEKLAPLLKPFAPGVIVIGGGVLARRGFLEWLEAAFQARGLTAKIKLARFRKNGVAIGAALLFNKTARCNL
jgi:predicted NBD/HSP70 family sugar kinase